MTAPTPERLQQLAERYDDEMIRPEHVAELLVAVDHLTAEVERLRADVRSLQRGSQRNADAHMVTHRDNARLRAGIEALHGAVQEFEPCPDGPWGCDELTCTESVHTGEWYHDDQPTGRVCLTCRYEDGEPHDWPCPTAVLLNPLTEGTRP